MHVCVCACARVFKCLASYYNYMFEVKILAATKNGASIIKQINDILIYILG